MSGNGHHKYWGELLKEELLADNERLRADLTKRIDVMGAQIRKRPTKKAVAAMIAVAVAGALETTRRLVKDGQEDSAAAIEVVAKAQVEHEKDHRQEVMMLRTEQQNSANRIEARIDEQGKEISRTLRALIRRGGEGGGR